jgi:hypothetical protein
VVAALAARNANEATVAPMVGSDGVCVWQESEIWQSDCVGASDFCRREYVFTFNLLYKEIL